MPHEGVAFQISDRYEYVGPRVMGGQGYVYKYKDVFLQRNVAVKEMKYVGDADDLRDELARIREIRSRHVVEVYDLLEAKHSKAVALVEEYIPGKTLEELITTEKLTKKRATKLLWQVACGLADIHTGGVIHRDIKPQNLKLDAEGIVKILDFGLSSIAVPDAVTEAARGTKYYLAPEMYKAKPIPLSFGIDVYAFGVTAWGVLNGGEIPGPLKETPPQSRNLVASLQTSKLVLPKRVTDLLDCALSIDPIKRPNIEEIRDALKNEITFGQHRLVVRHMGVQHVVSTGQPRATLKVGPARLTINYNGFNFAAEEVEGDVYLNNAQAQPGSVVPDSCVITFGGPGEGPSRTFVPVTVLTPEVVL